MQLLKYILYRSRPIFKILNVIWYRFSLYYLFYLIKKKAKRAGKKREFNSRPKLLWGPVPILNNKYWSNALKELGYKSHTLMTHFYEANNKEDFDYYLGNFATTGKFTSKYLKHFIPHLDFIKAIEDYDIIHIPVSGFILSEINSPFKDRELEWLKLAGVKIVVLPYGGDFFRYSRIRNPLLANVLLKTYPEAARNEVHIQKNIDRWVANADIFLPAIALDGIGRWDVVIPSTLTIDTEKWASSTKKERFNGQNGTVKIIHTPNHRGFKGTDFIIKACEDLKKDGLQLELILVEGRTNEEVAELMQHEADILVEQLIFNGYALSGLEGMSSGLPVLANLDNQEYTELFYLFSFLNECPIFSTTPYTVKDNLRLLITKPELRKELGQAGRQYVEKYHSNKSAQFIFENIYQKIWFNKEVDLMELFEPLKPNSYNNRTEKIKHPLVKGKLV